MRRTAPRGTIEGGETIRESACNVLYWKEKRKKRREKAKTDASLEPRGERSIYGRNGLGVGVSLSREIGLTLKSDTVDNYVGK